MAYALEVYNAAGARVMSSEDRITKKHSLVTITVTGFTEEIFYAVPGMLDDGTWMVLSGFTMYGACRIVTGGFYYRIWAFGTYTVTYLVLRV